MPHLQGLQHCPRPPVFPLKKTGDIKKDFQQKTISTMGLFMDWKLRAKSSICTTYKKCLWESIMAVLTPKSGIYEYDSCI